MRVGPKKQWRGALGLSARLNINISKYLVGSSILLFHA